MKTKLEIYCQNPRLNETHHYPNKHEGLEALREFRGATSCTAILYTDAQTAREREIARTGNGNNRLQMNHETE